MVYRRKHAEMREVSSGRVTEIYLTPKKVEQLKAGKQAWVRVQHNWIVLNPFLPSTKTKEELRIEKLENKLAELKANQKTAGGGKSSRTSWMHRLSSEERAAHMAKMRDRRKNKKINNSLT